MKIYSITYLIGIIVTCNFLIACTNEEPITIENTLLQANTPKTRSADDFDSNWENYETFTLADGQSITMPWKIGTSSTVHFHIRDDIKKEDGWTMLTHSLNREPNLYDIIPHYIALYNQGTGDIKVFINLNKDPMEHSTGTWSMYFTGQQGWMNSLNEVALPSPFQYQPSYRWETTVSPQDNNSLIGTGWNYFTIPSVAYDPHDPSDIGLHVSTIGYKLSIIELTGSTEGELEGKIISMVSENGSSKKKGGIVSMIGKGAESILKEILGISDTNTRSLFGSLFSGLGDLVKKGAAEILNGLTGKSSTPQPDMKDIRLNLHATTTLKGKMTTVTPTGLPSFDFEIGKDKTGIELGAWTLSENPTIYMHPIGVLYGPERVSSPPTITGYDATYQFIASGSFKADIVINPQLKPHVKSYTIDCKPVKYVSTKSDNIPQIVPSEYNYSDFGSIGALKGNGNYLDSYNKEMVIYSDSNYSILRSKMLGITSFFGVSNKFGKNNDGNMILYKYMNSPENYDLIRAMNGQHVAIACENHFVKVIVTMELEFEGKRQTVITSRTYKPKFEWDPNLSTRYKNLSISALQSIAAMDNTLKDADNGYYETIKGMLSRKMALDGTLSKEEALKECVKELK